MPVFRVEKNKDFTVMSNHHLRNQNISLKAKGLLSQMHRGYGLEGVSWLKRLSVKEAMRRSQSWISSQKRKRKLRHFPVISILRLRLLRIPVKEVEL